MLPIELQGNAERVVRWEDDPTVPCNEVHAIGEAARHQARSPYRPTFCPWLSVPPIFGDRAIVMHNARTSENAPARCPHCNTKRFVVAECACLGQAVQLALEGCTDKMVRRRDLDEHVDRARLAKAAQVKLSFESQRARRPAPAAGSPTRQPATGLKITPHYHNAKPCEMPALDVGYFESIASADLQARPGHVVL